MSISREQLLKLAPNVPSSTIDATVRSLNIAMKRYGIDTPKRVAHFIAQIAVESGHFSVFRENMNYSANGLMKTWPTRFKNLIDAQFYERQPAKIANYVYANRMGNGDEKSGEGWKHRGAGWIQITGKSNQKECALALGCKGDIGDYLSTIEGAAMSAAWFWYKSGCNRLADTNNVDAVSDVINIGHRTQKIGDSIGYDKRLLMTNAALKVFGA